MYLYLLTWQGLLIYIILSMDHPKDQFTTIVRLLYFGTYPNILTLSRRPEKN